MLKRVLIYGLPALALFVCVWSTRVFLAVDIVALFMRMAGLLAIGSVAVVGGLLPSVPLGIAYGLDPSAPRAPRGVHGGIDSLRTGTCVRVAQRALVVVYDLVGVADRMHRHARGVPGAAWLGSRLFPRLEPATRRRIGIGVFVLFTLCAIAIAWLYGCLQAGTCGFGS